MAFAKPRANGMFTGIYRDAAGRERSAGTYGTDKEAIEHALNEEAKIRLGIWTDPDAGNMTLTEYFEEHWIKHRTLEINGREAYLSHWRSGIKPKFGAMPLSRIKRPMIQAWVTEMKDAGVTASTISRRIATLRVVLGAQKGTSAVNDGLIDHNPCIGVTVPPVPTREVQIYLPHQVDAIIGELHQWWRTQVYFDADQGLRFGELTALQVHDIDFLRRRAPVRRSIVETRKANTGNGTRFVVKEYTKALGANQKPPRVLGLSTKTCEILAQHIERRGLGGEDFLFAMPVITVDRFGQRHIVEEVERTDVWPNGVPISRNYFGKVWGRAVEAAGLPYRRPHDLRASFASWLADDPSMDAQKVMDIVGWTRIETYNRYRLRLSDVLEDGIAAIERARERYGA